MPVTSPPPPGSSLPIASAPAHLADCPAAGGADAALDGHAEAPGRHRRDPGGAAPRPRRSRRDLRVEVLDDDAEAHPAELDAFATRIDDAVLDVVVDGREIEVAASTPPALADYPLTVFIQSAVDPTEDPVAATAMDAFERALAAIGTVVERSTNF